MELVTTLQAKEERQDDYREAPHVQQSSSSARKDGTKRNLDTIQISDHTGREEEIHWPTTLRQMDCHTQTTAPIDTEEDPHWAPGNPEMP